MPDETLRPTAHTPAATGVSDEAAMSLAETIMVLFRLLRQDRGLRGTAASDLDPSLLPVLGALSHGPARVGELADLLHGDMSTVSRQVSHLVDEGHASKVADPADRRVMQVSLTDHGRRTLDRVCAARAARLRDLLHDWTPEEIDILQRQLDRLARAASERVQPTATGHPRRTDAVFAG